MKLREAREQIKAILAQISTQELPKFRDKDGCLWFDDLAMGWISSTRPERLAYSQIEQMFAAESASRELIRRASSEDGAR